MSGTNHIHSFAAGAGANTMTQAAWEALIAAPGGGVPTNGFVDGIASATQINTVLRQVSVVASALAQFIVDAAAIDVNDDGSVANFEAGFEQALAALYVPLSELTNYVQLSAFTGAHQALQPNGHQDLPGGYTFRHGTFVAPGGGNYLDVPFDEPFPNACLSVVPVSANASTVLALTSKNPASFRVQNGGGTGYYIAVGY